MTLYRAEGSHEDPGYSGRVDERTGRYFAALARALRYCVDDRHLFEVDLTDEEAARLTGWNPEDHVLLTPEQAARKVHSPCCPHEEHR